MISLTFLRGYLGAAIWVSNKFCVVWEMLEHLHGCEDCARGQGLDSHQEGPGSVGVTLSCMDPEHSLGCARIQAV